MTTATSPITGPTTVSPKALLATTMPALIQKKRDRHTLTQHEIEAFIVLVASGVATAAQVGAMLMAIFLNGLDDVETAHLTRAMTRSGTILEWNPTSSTSLDSVKSPPSCHGIVVDKHSTGGVGDKVSLVLAPVLAACGLKVPMVSGRGLGHTGGTIDKLESIPGFNARLSSTQIKQTVNRIGCCITGQTSDMAPADGILYATRDVTSTVECNPLITASILSKKAAEGISHLLMDVKFGRGAFMPTLAAAEEQARSLVATGTAMGMAVSAVYSEMDNPIGRRVGSALEVVDAVECLRGAGAPDLMELVLVQAAILLLGANKCKTIESALCVAATTIQSGEALRKFHDMLVAQQVPPSVAARLCNPSLPLADATDILPRAPSQSIISAPSAGTLNSIDSFALSIALRSLGAGRLKPTDNIKHFVGVELLRGVGDIVKEGEAVAIFYHDDDDSVNALAAVEALENAFEITNVADVAGYDDSFLLENILSVSLPPHFVHGKENNDCTRKSRRRRIVKIQTYVTSVLEGVNGFISR